MLPHNAIINVLLSVIKKKPVSKFDQVIIEKYRLGDLIEYWKTKPKIAQKMRLYLELFLFNQTKHYNKAVYKNALAELGRMDRTGTLVGLFIARHPFFVAYLAMFLGPFAGNALLTQPMSNEEAEEFVKTPVPDDQMEILFYPKHVAIHVRDQYFDVGNRKFLKITDNPEDRPRLDGATFVRIQGDPGLAERVLTRARNYPPDKLAVYKNWNSTCLNNAVDLARDEAKLCVPPIFSNHPSSTESYLKVLEVLGSSKIVQIKVVAPNEELRKLRQSTTSTSWLFRTTKYMEAILFYLDLAILDELHDSAEVNFPKEKQSQ